MAPTPPERPFRVHLTGFGPFRQYSENPSWLAVRELEGLVITEPPPARTTTETPSEPELASPAPHRHLSLSTSLIPVNYTDALALVPPLHHKEEPYDLIIHVGVGAPGKIVLERRARRWNYTKEGADGKLAEKEKDGKKRGFVGEEWNVEEELQTRVKREKVVEWARRRGVEKLGLSNDAGLYLCEFTFFCSLATAERKASAQGSPPTPVQFIHVPPLKEPYNVEQLTSALKLLVWAIVNEGGLDDPEELHRRTADGGLNSSEGGDVEAAGWPPSYCTSF